MRLTLLFGVLLLLPLVSAEILISQPENIYNLDDELSISITLNPNNRVIDELIVDIVCDNRTVKIYEVQHNLNVGEVREVNIDYILTRSKIGFLVGECRLAADYGVDRAFSQNFELSDGIDIDLDLKIGRFNPGDEVRVSGDALKLNGEKVVGFIEIRVDDVGVAISKTVYEGEFTFNFTLPEDSPAGKHLMNVRVYEKDSSGETSNEGNITKSIEINQILKKLEINTAFLSVSPGEELTFSVTPYDQAEYEIKREISIIIYEPGDFVFLKKLINAGEENTIKINLGDAPGYWKIEARAGDVSVRKLFYVEDNEEALFSLINNTLIITNVGNVLYKKAVEISIGSAVEIKHLSLDVGETQKFRLFAPDGTYLIRVKDGDKEAVLGNTLLTGKVIGVTEVREGILASFSNPLLWILGIFLLTLIIVYVYLKKIKGKFKLNLGKSKIKKETSSDHPVLTSGGAIAGGKEEASVIALKLNNKISSRYASSYLEKALMTAKSAGAKIYVDENYRIILFSTSLTKKKDNELIAVKVSKKIEGILSEYNKQFKEKIYFGLGISNGQIIIETAEGKFKFTSVGKVISVAKKLANLSEMEVLLSDTMHRRVITVVKTKKVKKDAWKVIKITERDKHKNFLSRFSNK